MLITTAQARAAARAIHELLCDRDRTRRALLSIRVMVVDGLTDEAAAVIDTTTIRLAEQPPTLRRLRDRN